MIYQVHREVNTSQIEELINTLAEQGWRLHSIVPHIPNSYRFLVTMQLEKGKDFTNVPF